MVVFLNKSSKLVAAKAARDKKNKLELVMLLPKASQDELKQTIAFYDISKEILELKEKGAKNAALINVLRKSGYANEELELILAQCLGRLTMIMALFSSEKITTDLLFHK